MKKTRKITVIILSITAIAALSIAPAHAAATPDSTDNTSRVTHSYTIGVVSDAQRIIAEFAAPESSDIEILDVNRNGVIDINDATAIQRHLAEIEIIG